MARKGKINFCFFLSWILMVGGTLCILVAVATSYWRGQFEMHEGIFQRCTGPLCEDVQFFSGKDKELDLIRILILIGTFYTGLAMFLGILSLGPPTAVTILRALSFIHCGVALGLYAYFYGDMTFYWSFYLCWVGLGIFALGFAILFSLNTYEERREKDLPEDSDSSQYTTNNQ